MSYINHYFISWKGYGEDKPEDMKISVEEGTRLIARWQSGDAIFILKGGAYSFSSVKSIAPLYYSDKPAMGALSVEKTTEVITGLIAGKKATFAKPEELTE